MASDFRIAVCTLATIGAMGWGASTLYKGLIGDGKEINRLKKELEEQREQIEILQAREQSREEHTYIPIDYDDYEVLAELERQSIHRRTKELEEDDELKYLDHTGQIETLETLAEIERLAEFERKTKRIEEKVRENRMKVDMFQSIDRALKKD